MHESSFDRSINIETEDIQQAIPKATKLINNINKLAEKGFSAVRSLDLTVSGNQTDTFILLVSGDNFKAELNLEIAKNIRYLQGEQQKYLSLIVSGFAESQSLDRVDKIGKETKFWFKLAGFIVGAFLGFFIIFWISSGRSSSRGGGYFVYFISVVFGTLFAKIGGWIWNYFFQSEKQSLEEDSEFQTYKRIWEEFIGAVKQLLDNEYGEHNPNKFSEQANKQGTTVDLKTFLFPFFKLDKISLTENFKKIHEGLNRFSDCKTEDAFIIFENQSTENFVQFAKSKKSNFVLNIPMNCIDSIEYIRTEKYFKKITKNEIGEILFDKSNGLPRGKNKQFYMVLPDNSEIVTGVVLGFFTEVYKLPAEFKLRIEESFAK